MHPICLRTFILVKISDNEPNEFGWAYGRDLPINGSEIKAIVDKETGSLDSLWKWGQTISNMISDIRIKAIKNMDKIISDQRYLCRYSNAGNVVDSHGLLNNCQKIQIDEKLTELWHHTRRNQSDYSDYSMQCSSEGVRGVVIIVKNDSKLPAAEEFNKYTYLHTPKSESRFESCQNSIILVYIYETAFVLVGGDDFILTPNELQSILKKQLEKVNADQWINAISNIISDVQIGVVRKLHTIDSSDMLVATFLYVYKIAIQIGFVGNILCILAILFTKLIQTPVNKYLVVLLTSDTFFIIWLLIKDQFSVQGM
ncbi:hypothetical protein Ddc_16649 [Ditylenchus destructor]|nr:hypothetical protein Ddc_16649 [Ditylenchus destructor]